jgi:hypothetical protein
VYCPVFVLTAMKTSNLAVFHHSHAAQSWHLTELPVLVRCRFCIVSHAFLCVSKSIMPRNYVHVTIYICAVLNTVQLNISISLMRKWTAFRRLYLPKEQDRMCQDVYESRFCRDLQEWLIYCTNIMLRLAITSHVYETWGFQGCEVLGSCGLWHHVVC